MNVYHSNIEDETVANQFYRNVLFTGQKLQLVVMSLKAGEEIPRETHEDIDQFIRIEKGQAFVEIDGKKLTVCEEEVIIIPAGTEHYVKNASETDELKLYSIYAGPEHLAGTVHKTKAESDAAEHHH